MPNCGRFPEIFDLNVSDTHWQVTKISKGTFYLFNAYYDDREALPNGPVIRILSLINVLYPTFKTYCQMWFKGMNDPISVAVKEYSMLWPDRWGVNEKGATPYLVSCPNPFSSKNLVPQFVSLVEKPCDESNNLMKVRYEKPVDEPKQKFLVSVKNFDFFEDLSLLLIEWCEILKILGVNKVEIFVVNAHPNVMRLLEYYQSEGFVTIKFIKFPRELPNKFDESYYQWTQNDLVPYQDSFYENMYRYEYMIPMDIDEFIMPLKNEDRTWMDLLDRTIEKSRASNENFDAFPVSNMYFLLKSIHENETYEGIPKNLRFLSNIYRSTRFTPNGGNAKTFMRMDRVFIVNNHFPYKCLGKGRECKLFDVQQVDAQMAHYRIDCYTQECKESKSNPTKDTTLWKYKEEILQAVKTTIEKLKEFKSDVQNYTSVEKLDFGH